MNILIVSASLNPDSKSAQLADRLSEQWVESDLKVSALDLRKADLPMCDGGSAYGDERVLDAKVKVEAADAIVFATPIYVYGVNAALKNLVELTGRSMEGKVTGFLCAAGGRMSYMSVMSFANSLMLDFRMFVLPRIVYVASEDWNGDVLGEEAESRIGQFATSFEDFARRMQ